MHEVHVCGMTQKLYVVEFRAILWSQEMYTVSNITHKSPPKGQTITEILQLLVFVLFDIAKVVFTISMLSLIHDGAWKLFRQVHTELILICKNKILSKLSHYHGTAQLAVALTCKLTIGQGIYRNSSFLTLCWLPSQFCTISMKVNGRKCGYCSSTEQLKKSIP